MQGNRGSDTRPEIALRAALHRQGFRFFKNRRPVTAVPCRADIVFPRCQLAVFLDGCFWHRCPEHGILPKTNRTYWTAKLDGNVARDRRNDEALREAGWRVLRIWEHEQIDAAVVRVSRALAARDSIVVPA